MTPVGLALGLLGFVGIVVLLAAPLAWLGDRMRAHADRLPVDLDARDGVTVPCHSTGPRGGHTYRGDSGGWTCARCGDRVEVGA